MIQGGTNCDSSSGDTCIVTVRENRTVSVTFVPQPTAPEDPGEDPEEPADPGDDVLTPVPPIEMSVTPAEVEVTAGAEASAPVTIEGAAHAPGQALVQLADGAILTMQSQPGVSALAAYSTLAASVQREHGLSLLHAGWGTTPDVLDTHGRDPLAVARELERDPRIAFAEPNYPVDRTTAGRPTERRRPDSRFGHRVGSTVTVRNEEDNHG